MKHLASLISSIVIATWIVAIAILALKNENLQPVSLKFLTFQSINLPFFLVLAGSAALGMILIALIQPLWSLGGSQARSQDELDDDFSFEE